MDGLIELVLMTATVAAGFALALLLWRAGERIRAVAVFCLMGFLVFSIGRRALRRRATRRSPPATA